MNRKFAAVTAAVLMLTALLSLTGCANLDDRLDDPLGALSDYYGPQNEEPKEALTTFALPYASGETVDPVTCSDGAQQTLGALLYEPLYALDAQFTPYGVLAASQVYNKASCTYTISLRRDVTFSDGTPLTAQDAVDTLTRAMVSPRYAARLREVTLVEAAGSAVRITLSSDNASFISRLDIPIVKSGTESATFPTGTGPYVFSAAESCLTPNAGWWQDTPLPFPQISLRAYKSSDAMAYAFSARDIHLLFCDLTATSSGAIPSGGDYTDAETTTMQFIGFSTAGLFSDTALRRAVNRVINRQSLINAYLLGHGTSADFPVNPASELYPSGDDARSDTTAYYAALEEAGLTDGTQPRRVVMLVNEENAFRVSIAQDIARTLSQGDLTVEVSVLPWDAFSEALQSGHFDMYYGECRLTADWDMRDLAGTGGAMNYGGYASDVMDVQLAACAAATGAQRSEAFAHLDRLWQRESPLAVVCFKRTSLLLPSGTVSGAAPTGGNPFSHLESWQISWAEE